MNFTYINPAIFPMLGFTPEEWAGSSLSDHCSKEEMKKIMNLLSKMMKNESYKTTLEMLLIHKNGRKIPAEIQSLILLDENEELIGIQGTTRDITERKLAEDKLKASYERLQKLIQETVNVLANVVELRDPYTAGHQHNVAQLAVAIANEMGFSEEMIEGVRIGGTMHDIGKIKVPIEILTKTKKLTNEEWEQIKYHSFTGYELLKDLDFPWQVAQMIHQHHERFNGSGYPNGLKNDDILMEARILAVADVVESMANDRPYRKSLGLETALEEIEDNKGILYDPDVVENAIKILRSGAYIIGKSILEENSKEC